MNDVIRSRFRLPILLAALLVALGPALPAPAQGHVPPVSLERRVSQAFDREAYDEAARLLERSLEDTPNHPVMLYNLACAYSRLDRVDEAASALFRAIENGFRDFSHLRRDPDLAAVRGHATYQAILEAADRVDEAGARDELARWRRRYGEENYRYETCEDHRLNFATALDDISHREMRAMLEAEADHLIDALFDAPPDYYVLIAVPTPRDAARIFDDESIGGIYEHSMRRLISRDTGGSLRHEFFHVMHYGHMERLKQSHPIWVQEGMASLYEDYELGPDGSITYLPNVRHNIVRNLARANRLVKWRDVMSMSSTRFMSASRVGRMYPIARSIFEFVADRGKLSEWYRQYVKDFPSDRTGMTTFETVFGMPLEEIEREWRQWVRSRPAVDTVVREGDASLGIQAGGRDANDGVVIQRIFRGSAAQMSRLRVGDVIVSIDEQPVRTIKELQTVIGRQAVGDRLKVRARREGVYFTADVTLRPLGQPSEAAGRRRGR